MANPGAKLSSSDSTPAPKRRVLLFEFAHHEHQYRCELLDHESLGIEAQFSKNGEFLEGCVFETMPLAVAWANALRKTIQQENDG